MQSGTIGLRQYVVNGGGYTISVSGLPTGVTYNSGLERLEGAATGTSSGTATFTLSRVGGSDVVDTATVALVEQVAGLPDYYDSALVPATLWVNGATGDDSYTRAQILAGGGALQWATIERAARGAIAGENAAEAAQPGDVVQVAGGIYEVVGVAGYARFNPLLNPANSGTAENPIIFRADPNDRVEIRAAANSARGPLVGCINNRSYIYWHGFRINDYYGASSPDTGPVHFGGGATGCRLTGCNISGHSGSYFYGYPTFTGNYRLVSVEGATAITVADNKIWRAMANAGSGGQNEAGVMTYSASDCVFEHNEIFDCGAGFFIKGQTSFEPVNNMIRLNKVRSCYHASIRVLTSNDSYVVQNLVYESVADRIGFSVDQQGLRYINNTCVVTGNGLQYQSANQNSQVFRNNLFAEHGGAWNALVIGPSSSVTPIATHEWDRNFYAHAGAQHFYDWDGGSIARTIAQWTGLDQDANSIFGQSPQFVDAASNDYRLQAGSPARTLGRDYLNLLGGGTDAVIPVGCYITGNEVLGPRIAVPGD